MYIVLMPHLSVQNPLEYEEAGEVESGCVCECMSVCVWCGDALLVCTEPTGV